MKKFRSILLAVMVALAISVVTACSTAPTSSSPNGAGSTPPSAQGLTPQQIAKIVCPPLQTSLTQLQAIYDMQVASASSAKVLDALGKASPVISEACSVGATVSTANIQSFVSTALPELATVAGSLPLSASDKDTIQTALLTAQLALGVYNVVQAQMAAASGLPASASTAAPAAASSVVK